MLYFEFANLIDCHCAAADAKEVLNAEWCFPWGLSPDG